MVVVGKSNNLISSVFSFVEWPAEGASRKVKQVRQAGSRTSPEPPSGLDYWQFRVLG